MNVLSLAWRQSEERNERQPGQKSYPQFVRNMPERSRAYLDFVIDGRSLRDLVDPNGFSDLVSPLGGWMPDVEEARALDYLLGDLPDPETKQERVELFVCPTCADLGCRSITAELFVSDDSSTLREFALEKNWQLDAEDPYVDKRGLEHVGPFVFDKKQYRQAIQYPPPRPAPAM